MDLNAVISVKNFSKSFGNNKVIHDLSFDVHKGEIFAFLGANGSGKTTTIRALLGIYEADTGELLVNGKKYSQKDASLLGYLPEERGLYLSSRVLETIIYFGQLKGLSYEDAKKNALDFLEKVELADKANTTIQKLSSGQQQKIQLGITAINKPELLILDEPTKGLDPVNRGLLMDILFELNREGSTILFSTHQMDEVERIANRLIMIKKGVRKLYGEINEVKSSFGNNTIHLVYKGKIPENLDLFDIKIHSNHAEISPKENISTQKVLEFLIANNVEILKFELATPSLEEIFIKVSKEDEK